MEAIALPSTTLSLFMSRTQGFDEVVQALQTASLRLAAIMVIVAPLRSQGFRTDASLDSARILVSRQPSPGEGLGSSTRSSGYFSERSRRTGTQPSGPPSSRSSAEVRSKTDVLDFGRAEPLAVRPAFALELVPSFTGGRPGTRHSSAAEVGWERDFIVCEREDEGSGARTCGGAQRDRAETAAIAARMPPPPRARARAPTSGACSDGANLAPREAAVVPTPVRWSVNRDGSSFPAPCVAESSKSPRRRGQENNSIFARHLLMLLWIFSIGKWVHFRIGRVQNALLTVYTLRSTVPSTALAS
jgi:hypothetical protein